MISNEVLTNKLKEINTFLQDSIDQKNEVFIEKIVDITERLSNSELNPFFSSLLP